MKPQCAATLQQARSRADALERWLRAFSHRPGVYSVRDVVVRTLEGVPVGVKDLADTRDMPTSYGSPICDGHRPANDARIVGAIRARRAPSWCKTATTEFASRGPSATVNLWNRAHTPAGSSSGSAAAVGGHRAACRQRANGWVDDPPGSLLRRIAMCRQKACISWLRRFDHIGFFERSVEDAAIAHAVFVDALPETITNESAWRTYFDGGTCTPTLGVISTSFWNAVVAPHQRANFDASPQRLSQGGASIVELTYGTDLR